MKILVVRRTDGCTADGVDTVKVAQSVEATEPVVPTVDAVADLVVAAFTQAGATVETVDFSEPGDMRVGMGASVAATAHQSPVIPGGTAVRIQPDLRQMAARFVGQDVVVYVTDQISFADAGGPYLRQVATWAERSAIPVIAVARQCQISTRELRTVGVEAAYAVTDQADALRLVQTWGC